MNDQIIKIGSKIKSARLEKGLTQENVCDLIKISERAYGNIERGKTICSLPNLIKIAKVLNISMDYLLFDIDFTDDENEIHKLIKKFDSSTSFYVEEIIENYINIQQHKK